MSHFLNQCQLILSVLCVFVTGIGRQLLNFIATSRKKYTEYKRTRSGADGSAVNTDDIDDEYTRMCVETFQDRCKIPYVRKQRGVQSVS